MTQGALPISPAGPVADPITIVQAVIDAMPNAAMVLRDGGRIVAANKAVAAILESPSANLAGQQLGQIIGCPYWKHGAERCGGAPQCLSCVATQAFAPQNGDRPVSGDLELHASQQIVGGSPSLRLRATPMQIAGQRYVVCSMEDVSGRLRMQDLSLFFFHDLLNMLTGIQGHLAAIGGEIHCGQAATDVRRLRWLADLLVDEVESQRDLVLAQADDLEVVPQVVRTAGLMDDLRYLYSPRNGSAEGRRIELGAVWDGVIVTDLRLLNRVLGNMLRNALEATGTDGVVSFGCEDLAATQQVRFTVHNAGVIPEQIQQAMLHRAYSSKAPGRRGIGLRSIKLLGERYLRGKVEFESCAESGTTFAITIPKVL